MTNTENNVNRMDISSGKEVVLDLNGKEINSIGVNETNTSYNDNHVIFRIYGSFIINDITNNGGMYTGISAPPIRINGGNVIINGGNYNGRQVFNVYNQGNIEINNGEFNCLWNATVVASNGNVTINNGIFKNNNSLYTGTLAVMTYDRNVGVIRINGGIFTAEKGITILNNPSIGSVEITGGTFTSTGRTILNNSGTINISGGNFKSQNESTIYNASSGTININGSQATFDNQGNYISGVYVHNESTSAVRMVYNYGTMTINNGTFISSSGRVIDNNMGNIYINNGIYKSICDTGNQWANATVVQEFGGNIIINDGYFESLNGFGIINAGDGDTGSFTIKNATIKSYSNSAIKSQDNDNAITNICRLTLVSNKDISNTKGYIYYHTNAFGSVTPTFSENTTNIQIKDSVCD